MARFYNPGTKIEDRLQYTHPTKDPRDGSTLSYHLLQAEEKDFFDVPDVLTLNMPEGELQVPVNFTKRVRSLYRDRGVILIDPRAVDADENDNIAQNEQEAQKKGRRLWREHLKSIVQEHYTNVQEVRSNGGVPRAARGLTAFALKELNMEDPADQVGTITRVREQQGSDERLRQELQALRDQLNQLQGAQGAQGAKA